MEENIFAAIKIDDIEKKISDLNDLEEYERNKESCIRLITTLVASHSGKTIENYNGLILCEIHLDAADVFKEISHKLKDEMSIYPTIGIGETPDQSMAACKWAFKNKHGHIKLFEPEMDEDSVEESSSCEDSRPNEIDTFNRSEDLNKADQPIQAPIEPIDTDPIPGTDEEKQDVKYNLHSENEDQPKELTPNAKDVPNEQKMRAAQILSTIQQNKEFFDKLKEQEPELYASVVGVVNSLTQVLKDNHIEKQTNKMKQLIETATKDAQNKKDNENQDLVQEHAKEALSEIIQEENKKKEFFNKMREIHKNRHKVLKENPDMSMIFALARMK